MSQTFFISPKDSPVSPRFIWGTFLAFLGMFVFLYFDVVFQSQSFSKRDIVRYYFPMWKFAVDTLKTGTVPFWNPYHYFGAPFAANVQNCVFYPFQALLHFSDYTWAFNFYIFVHLALSATLTSVWMRDLGTSKAAAWTAGIAFSLSGYMASAINLTISLACVTYFPLVLICFRRALAEKRFFWRGWLACAFLFQYLAGDPSIIFSTILVLGVFCTWRTFELFLEKKYRQMPQPFLRLTSSLGLFMGLGAFQYLLFYEFLKQSNRAVLSYDGATMWSVQLNDLIALAIPFFQDLGLFFMSYWERQSWMEQYYAGASVLLLAACAIIWRRDRMIAFHFIMALFSIGLAFGRFSWVHWFFNQFFPFFNLIRYPVRFLYIAYFGIACLAGFAVHFLQQGSLQKPSRRSLALWMTAILAGSMLVFLSVALVEWTEANACLLTNQWLQSLQKRNWDIILIKDITGVILNNGRRTLFFAVLTATLILAWRTGRSGGRLAVAFALILIFTDLGLTNAYEFKADSALMTRTSKRIAKVQSDPDLFRVYVSPTIIEKHYKPEGDTIVEMQQSLMDMFTPNFLINYGLQDMNGYDSLQLRYPDEYRQYRRTAGDPGESRYYDLINAKYFISTRGDLTWPSRLADEGPRNFMYENRTVLPRAFWVARAVVEPDESKWLGKMRSTPFDPRERLYLTEPPKRGMPDEGWPESPGVVSIDRYSINEVSMSVESRVPGWLFFSDTYYPGWTARVDGELVPIERANHAFRAIFMEPGRHQVLWKYDPILFKIGSAISLLTALGLAALMARGRYGH